MSYTDVIVTEKLLSSIEVPVDESTLPTYAHEPKQVEEIYEIILIRTNNVTNKREKITRTVKKIKKTYGIKKCIAERRKWAKFGEEIDNPNTPITSDPVEFKFTNNENQQPVITKKKDEFAEDAPAFDPTTFMTKEPVKTELKNEENPVEEAVFVPNFLKIEERKKKYSVFINQIPGYIDTNELIDFLRDEGEKFGEVKFVKVPEKKYGDEQKSRIAFVDFCDKNVAEQFINSRVAIDGVILDKNWSKDK